MGLGARGWGLGTGGWGLGTGHEGTRKRCRTTLAMLMRSTVSAFFLSFHRPESDVHASP
jgi:hypothetical protein